MHSEATEDRVAAVNSCQNEALVPVSSVNSFILFRDLYSTSSRDYYSVMLSAEESYAVGVF